LLIISPIRADAIKLKRGGKVIATLKYYGVYSEGGFRYYAPSWGYKLGADLQICIGKLKYGICNGGFRDPTFR